MKWEYFTYVKNADGTKMDIMGDEFKMLGKQGWEMVSFAFLNQGTDKVTFFAVFKRQL